MLLAQRSFMQVVFAVLASTLLLSACGGSGSGGGGGVTLKSITVTPKVATLGRSSVVQLSATGTYSDNTSKAITSTVTWSSGNTAVATVGANTGLVTTTSTASNGQTAVITATSGTGSAALTDSATISVTVAATLTSIAVTAPSPSVAIYATLPLTATGTYSDSSTQNITSSVTWTSASPAVAKVGVNTGLVTAAAGAIAYQTAVITATSGALAAPITITVTAATSTVFDLTTVSDPLAIQQWSLLNTGQTGYADTSGVTNSGGTLGTDINVNPVYNTDGFTGKNVVVAVVDSGMEIAHEDLSANVVTGGSWNFINSTTDPTNTTATTGDHGTMVSGLIAMARNGIGGIGVAPNAQLKGFNYLGSSSTQTLANGVAALGGSSANPNSSNVAIFNQSFGTSNTSDFPMDTTIEAQYASGTSTLRGGKGAIYVKSAGNGFKSFAFSGTTETDGCNATGGANSVGVSCQNANFDPSNTLPYNIVMAALNAKGKKSSYSTAGSAIWASAPGGEYGNNLAAVTALGLSSSNPTIYDPAMVTTDQSGCTIGESRNPPVSGLVANGGPYSYFNQGGTNLASINLNCNYTNGMNGTSSAAPMMTGSIALILEANPALTWREVKDILAKTAVQVDAGILPINITSGMTGASGGTPYVAEQGWITNAASYKYHNWYGFGAVNVSAAVSMAKTYTSGSLGTFTNTGWISSGALTLAIPDNSATGVSVPLSVTTVGTSGIVEEVQLKLTTTNTLSGYTGDIGIELTSPSNTKSILKTVKDGFTGGNFAGMVLESNAFYGETSSGTWTAKVVDGWAGSTQTLTNVQIRVYGH